MPRLLTWNRTLNQEVNLQVDFSFDWFQRSCISICRDNTIAYNAVCGGGKTRASWGRSACTSTTDSDGIQC